MIKGHHNGTVYFILRTIPCYKPTGASYMRLFRVSNLLGFYPKGLIFRILCSLRSRRILMINPLSPNSDQQLISPHNITDSSNIQVTRMNVMITKDGKS